MFTIFASFIIPEIQEKLYISNNFIVWYIAGWICFFVFIGIIGIFIECIEMYSRENDNTIICCCYFGNGNNDDGCGLMIIFVIILLIIIGIIFGIFIGIWRFALYCYKIQQDRQAQIYKYSKTIIYRVKDRSTFITV